jgi:NAD(P)-dependent dehydrogenase (short-subunit alcohol dehydrogenase family)
MINQINISSVLSGKKVIVMGGSSGLGFATAKAAAAEGAVVTIVSASASRVDAALSELPEGSRGFALDLSEETNIQNFFLSIEKFDHLIYTAGENLTLNTFAETELEQAREFFTVRYWGAFAALKYGAGLINPGGSISLTSGIASLRPGSGWALASSICGAIEGLVRAAAVELAPIRVNCVVPGVVRTNLWNSMSEEDKQALYNGTASSILAGRAGEAEDIALSFLYLMKQTYGSGQCIVVDGGAVLV